MKQNNKLAAIKHEQEQETFIDNITIESVLELVEKDQKKVDFLLSDLTMQKNSLQKTIAANEDIVKNTQLLPSEGTDPATVEKLIAKWIEVVDLLDSKSAMVENATKARDKENADFRYNLIRHFELSPVEDYELNRELRTAFAILPVENLYRAVCSKADIHEDLIQVYESWIESVTLLISKTTRHLILDHFSERGMFWLT